MEYISSIILFAESYCLGELAMASFAGLIAYGNMLVIMYPFHLVDEYITSVRIRYCRPFIILCKVISEMCIHSCKCEFLSTIFAGLLTIMCFEYAMIGAIRFYIDTSIQAVLLKTSLVPSASNAVFFVSILNPTSRLGLQTMWRTYTYL